MVQVRTSTWTTLHASQQHSAQSEVGFCWMLVILFLQIFSPNPTCIVCCGCNRSGACKRCSCIKDGKLCDSCLVGKLEKCTNCSNTVAVPARTAVSADTAHSIKGPALSTVRLFRSVLSPRPSLAICILSHSLILDHSPSPSAASSVLLQQYVPAHLLSFMWKSISAPDFFHSLGDIYTEVVHWRCNCFPVPYGKVGKEFVSKL